jgi:aspartyl-tRNA(Asn)/glutamyl-tRNA(Gln) amidotransferase subunit A
VSATELTQALLARIRDVDGVHSHEGDPGSINAWVRVYEEDALAAAARADERLSAARVRRDGPAPVLTGIPVGLKDLCAVAGKPLTASSRMLEDVPTEDCDPLDAPFCFGHGATRPSPHS